MAGFAEDARPYQGENAETRRVTEVLGGRRVFSHPPRSPIEAHEAILQGLPSGALTHLVENLTLLEKTAAFEKAIGMSLRTFQRRRGSPARPLSQEQSGRVWKFAEILKQASDVFGSQEEAELWLERPAMGLDQRRPIDLLATPAGTELVQDFLTQLEFGVYV